MKEIKAYIHRNRVADVVHALRMDEFCGGSCNLSIIEVADTLKALDARERAFSLELGEEVITAVKLELVCEDGRVSDAVRIIRENGRTGQPLAGWIYVSDITESWPIKG